MCNGKHPRTAFRLLCNTVDQWTDYISGIVFSLILTYTNVGKNARGKNAIGKNVRGKIAIGKNVRAKVVKIP